MVNYITVKGTYLLPDGVTPNSGYVEFRPTVALTISDTGVVFSEPLRVLLDENGYIEIRLMATDNTSISPTGWLWFVDEKIEHGNQWYLQTKSTVNGGRDPLDITTVFYPPGASVTPPHVVDPAPIGPVGPPGKDATLYEGPSEPVEGVSIGTYSELWVDTDDTVDSTNDVILSGTVTPTPAIGSTGDYYLDTDDHILYGPNASSPVSIISAEPINHGAISGSNRSLGMRFQILRAGQITGLRFYRASSATQTGRTLSLWSDAGVFLASATTTGESGGGWKTAQLNTPYTVAIGEYYRVSYNSPNTAYYVYSPENPTTTSICFGDLLGYQGTGLDTFPGTASPGQHSFVDVVLQTGEWPLAIKSVPPGGTTSQVLNKTNNSDYAVSWVSIEGGVGGGGGGHTIEDEGVSLTSRLKLNFTGSGVTATDDSVNDRTVVTIPGSTSSGSGDSGTTILSGTAAPINSTGKEGYYYLDTDDRILYGPKEGMSGLPIPQPFVVGTTTDANSTSVNIVLSAPAGIQSGDMMVVYLHSSYNGAAAATFLRWTDVVTGTIAEMGATTRWHQVVSRIYSPDDPGPWTFAFPGIHSTTRKIGTMVAIRNTTPYHLHSLPIYSSPTDLSVSMALPDVGPGVLVTAWSATTGAPNIATVTTTNGTVSSFKAFPDATGTVSTDWQTVISKPVTGASTLTITSPGPTYSAEANAGIIAKQLPAVTADEDYLYEDVDDMLSREVFYWAHRGGTDHWGEFTRLGYDECIKWGAPALELSVNHTSDGVWFGLHDEFLNRMAPGQGMPANYDPTTHTWAEVNTYYSMTGNVVAKFFTLTEFLDRYKDTGRILILDAKYTYKTPTLWPVLLDQVLAKWPANRIVGKGDLNNMGWADICRTRGIKTWGYLYAAGLAALPAQQSHWDILGFEYDASQTDWDVVLAYGKPVVGFLIADQAGADMALARGAAGLQCTNVIKVIPRAPQSSETTDPWPISLKSVPPGGTTNQVLNKTNNSDYAVNWAAVSAGGGSVLGTKFVSVKDHGALGDGTTNDFAAITAAMTAAGVGGTIYFPPSTTAYMINAPLVPPHGLTIQGNDNFQYDLDETPMISSAIKAMPGFSGSALIHTATAVRGVVIKSMQFLGLGDATGSLNGIDFGPPSTGERGWLIDQCRFMYFGGAALAGHMHVIDVRDSHIARCGYGIRPMSGASGSACTMVDARIIGCQIYGIYHDGIHLNSTGVPPGGIVIVGTRIERCGVTAGAGAITPTSNRDQNACGIRITRGTSIQLIGNNTDANANSGLKIDAAAMGDVTLVTSTGNNWRRDGGGDQSTTMRAGVSIVRGRMISLIGDQITYGTPDDGGSGRLTPQYGIEVDSSYFVEWHGTLDNAGYPTGAIREVATYEPNYRCILTDTRQPVGSGSSSSVIEASTDNVLLDLYNSARNTTKPMIAASGSTTAGATSDIALQIGIGSEGFGRFRQYFDGGMGWGPGNVTRDTWLYRNGVGILKTDGQLQTGSVTGLIIAPASTTGGAYMRLTHGAAPTAPVNGDMWTTTAGLFVRINGVTKTVTTT